MQPCCQKSPQGLQPSRTQGPAHARGWKCFMTAAWALCGSHHQYTVLKVRSCHLEDETQSTLLGAFLLSWTQITKYDLVLSFRGLLHKAAQRKPMIICRCLLTIFSISPHVRAGEWPLLLMMCHGSVSARVGVDSGHGRGLFVVNN